MPGVTGGSLFNAIGSHFLIYLFIHFFLFTFFVIFIFIFDFDFFASDHADSTKVGNLWTSDLLLNIDGLQSSLCKQGNSLPFLVGAVLVMLTKSIFFSCRIVLVLHTLRRLGAYIILSLSHLSFPCYIHHFLYDWLKYKKFIYIFTFCQYNLVQIESEQINK